MCVYVRACMRVLSQVPVERTVQVTYDRVVERTVEIPCERTVERIVQCPVEVPGPIIERVITRDIPVQYVPQVNPCNPCTQYQYSYVGGNTHTYTQAGHPAEVL